MMKKSFERKYAINVGQLKLGKHEETFFIDTTFFEEFDQEDVLESAVTVNLAMEKFDTHLDVKFILKGNLGLPCDRCLEPYSYDFHLEDRIIYSFEKEINFKDSEVIFIDRFEANLSFVQEFYDFITLSIPLRKVPSPEVHICAPEVLDFLGLDSDGTPKVTYSDPEAVETDPRWEALKKLKKNQNN